jgi:signal transduction histidine kinase/CheY-like chemotaxis protein/HPt (histidine-containing phosphotransfer) domain-containing protein
MVHKPKAIKLKVILGYLLLFTFAVVSVWFVYTEILKVAQPANNDNDNKKVIAISNSIARLYASEAVGRTSILTLSENDHYRYNKALDSIQKSLDSIKGDLMESHRGKFDSIQLLLELKRNSVAEIIQYRKTTGNSNKFLSGISGIKTTKDSIVKKVKPIKIQKKYEWSNLVNSLLTPKQIDSLSKLKVSNDSLALAFDKVLTKLFIKDNNLQYELYLKEQKLLEENLVISDKLRALLSSVENEILHNSYIKMSQSQATIKETVNTMAWVGAAALFVLIVFAWVILSDLTSSQNYRKQLEVLNTENEQLLRSKTMLMATVTHDLQTPLGSIIGFSDLIDSSAINDKHKQYVSNIKESADYILKLVNDLLDFSKLENNRITIEEVSFNIKTLIENTCKTLVPASSNKNIELNWDIDEKLDHNFISDPYRIKQVLTNLVSNSIKFTQEGSVEVTAGIRENTIYLEVLDTGIGIAEEKQQDVFKEFTQAHSGIEKRFGGTGLGLTISKRIIELLGGTITLRSKLGEGSIFTITLPAKPCTASSYSEEEETVCNDFASLNGKRVLVIDDDRTQLALLKEVLTGYGVDVKTEANSSAVAALIEKEHYDLILTDIQMPVVDGFDIVNCIRNHPDAGVSSWPVIALSGRKDLEAKDYTAAGFTAHEAKPVDIKVLLAMIANLFGEKIEIRKTKKREQIQNSLFNLRSLSQFTQNDPESLRTIITTFIESADDNRSALKKAASERNEERVAGIAHKMIPMLRQMEVYSIVKLLDPLEDYAFDEDWDGIDSHILQIDDQMQELINKLRAEVA